MEENNALLQSTSLSNEQNRAFLNWFTSLPIEKITSEELIIAAMCFCGLDAREIITLNLDSARLWKCSEPNLFPFFMVPNVFRKQGYYRNVPIPLPLANAICFYVKTKVKKYYLENFSDFHKLPLFTKAEDFKTRLEVKEINNICKNIINQNFADFKNILEATEKLYISSHRTNTKNKIIDGGFYSYLFRRNYGTLLYCCGLQQRDCEYLLGLKFSNTKKDNELLSDDYKDINNVVRINKKLNKLIFF